MTLGKGDARGRGVHRRAKAAPGPASLAEQAPEPTGTTLQGRVQRRLSDMILDGDIVPGQLITIRNLAASFGVSAMPVREALKALVSANALAVVSGRSVGVPLLSAEHLADLSDVRQVVEGAALARAAERVDATRLAVIGTHLDQLQSAVAANDVKGYLRSNRAFHFSIYRSAGSPALLTSIEALWLQISPYFSLLSTTGNYRSANLRHREMLDALASRDPEQARRAVVGDIRDGVDVMSPLLSRFTFLTGKAALPPPSALGPVRRPAHTP